MILVDSRVGSAELAPHIRKVGVPCEVTQLPYGDFAFEGNGPKGRITVGIERKALHDMLHCIDDSRYAAFQRPGMLNLYDKSILMMEGVWRPHEDGWLMEGFNGGTSWGFCRYRSQKAMYAKLRRYLFSIALSGVIVLHTRDIIHTAYDTCELFHYFQKRWQDHTSLIETQKLTIASLNIRPPLVHRWASDIEDIGAKLSIEAVTLFKTPIALANSDESAWTRIRGIGVGTAQKIVKEIRGLR